LRGVGCEKALRKLLDKQLIEEAGRMDVIGRPVLYRTTQALLRHLHIASLDDLPSWEQLEHADDD
jgi:segregation and condensation protein B